MKLIKILLGITVALVLLVVVGVVGVALFFDPNEHKDLIIGKVQEETGRKLELPGEIKLTYYPWLGLESSGVTLGNAKGFGEEPFLHADKVAVRIKTMPLLKQQYELDTFKLHGLRFNLARDKDSRTNWDDLVKPAPEKEKKEAKPAQLGAVILGGVDIKDARITWNDQVAGQKVTISNLNASTGQLTYGEPIDLNVGLVAESDKPSLKTDLKLDGTLFYDLESEVYSFKPIDLVASLSGKNVPGGSTDLVLKAGVETNLDEETASLSDLQLDFLGLSVRGDITATGIKQPLPAANGRISIKGEDLARLMNVFELEAADGIAKLDDRSFDLQLKINADTDNNVLSITDLNADMLGTAARGKVDVNRFQTETPEVKGDIQVEGNDLLWMLHVAGMSEAAAEMGKIKDRSFSIKTDINADMKSDQLKVSQLDARLLDTVITGQLEVDDFQTEKPSLSTSLNAKGSDLSRLLVVGGMTDLSKQLGGVADRSFDIKAALQANMAKGEVNVSSLDARLLGAVIQGKVNAGQVTSGKPSAKGSLKATGPDLPALMQIAGQFAGKDSALTQYGQKLAKVDNKSFDLSADFDANLGKGNIDIPTLSAKGLGITLNGKLKGSDINSNTPDLDGNLSVRGEKLDGVLAAVDQAGLGEVLQLLTIDAGVKSSRGDIALSPLQVKATLAGKDIPNSPVDMTLTGDARANLDKQTLTVSDLAIKGLGLDVTTSLQAQKIMDAPEYKGSLRVAEFNLRNLAKQLNQQLPPTADNKVLTKVALSTDVAGTGDSVELNSLTVKLDESTLKGNVAVAQFDQPAIRFGLDIDNINADRYLPPPAEEGKKKKKAKPATPETAAGAAATELPLDTLRALNINGDLKIGQLVISNAKMSNVKLSIRAKDGDIKLDPVAADLYQGNYQALISLNAKSDTPLLQISNRLSKVQLEPLLKDVMQQPESQLAGEANIVADNLTASGRDVTQLKQTLNGKVNIDVRNGVLRGVDVRKILEQVEVMLESKRIGKVQEGGETRFEKLSATLNVNKGVINNNDLVMLSPGIKVGGKGMLADLNNESINYKLSLDVVEESATRADERYNIGGYQVPVYCKGSLNNLKSACQPDLAEIAKVAFKKGALEKIGEEIGIDLSGKKKTTKEATSTTTSDTSSTTSKESTQEQTEPTSPTEGIKKGIEGVGDVLKGIFD